MAFKASSPAELRSMFGANLRMLSRDYPSVSELSRQLAINRTQYNRYLSGESFPRPDVLARICHFFGVDARVLLESVENIDAQSDPISSSNLRDYVGAGARNVPEDVFPSGFYRFSRRSFVRDDQFLTGIVFVLREKETTFLRGYEASAAMQLQGLPDDAPTREFRGLVMQQEDGIAILASRHNAMTCSFNYLGKVASFENNYWLGYVTRTIPETVDGLRATRLVYEYLGPTARTALGPARAQGFISRADLPPYHLRLLRPDQPFI